MRTYGYISFLFYLISGTFLLFYAVAIIVGLTHSEFPILWLLYPVFLISFLIYIFKSHKTIRIDNNSISVQHMIPYFGTAEQYWLHEINNAQLKKLQDDSRNPFNFKKHKRAYFLILQTQNNKEHKILLRSLIKPERWLFIRSLRKYIEIGN